MVIEEKNIKIFLFRCPPQHDEQPDHKAKPTDVWDSFSEDVSLSINAIQYDASPDGAMNDLSIHTEQSHRQTGTESDVVPLHKKVNSLQDIIQGKHILSSTFHGI